MLSLVRSENTNNSAEVESAVESVRDEAKSIIGSDADLSEKELEKKAHELESRANLLESVILKCRVIVAQKSINKILLNFEKQFSPGQAQPVKSQLERSGRSSNGFGTIESPIPGMPSKIAEENLSRKKRDYQVFFNKNPIGWKGTHEDLINQFLPPFIAAQQFHPIALPTRSFRTVEGKPDFRKIPEFILGLGVMSTALTLFVTHLPTLSLSNSFIQTFGCFALGLLIARVGMTLGHFVGTLIRAPLIAQKRAKQEKDGHPEHILRSLVLKGVAAGCDHDGIKLPVDALADEFERQAQDLRHEAASLRELAQKVNTTRERTIVRNELKSAINLHAQDEISSGSLVANVADETRSFRISRLTREAFKLVERLSPEKVKLEIQNALESIRDAGKIEVSKSYIENVELARWAQKVLKAYSEEQMRESVKVELKAVVEMLASTYPSS